MAKCVLISMEGKVFGRLVVISRAEDSNQGHARWNCECTCGRFSVSRGDTLRNGGAKTCGKCYNNVSKITHGMTGTREYKSWSSMRHRCECDTSVDWKNYGGRGITVCDRWLEFTNFYEDMGDRPEGMSIDRVDNELGYSPDNCKWSTPKEQQNNRRSKCSSLT